MSRTDKDTPRDAYSLRRLGDMSKEDKRLRESVTRVHYEEMNAACDKWLRERGLPTGVSKSVIIRE